MYEGEIIMSAIEMSVSEAYAFFITKADFDISILLQKMESLKDPLATIGMYGVESMKEHSIMNRYISKLKKLKKLLEED